LSCYDRNSKDSGYRAAKLGIKSKRVAEQGLSIIKGKPSVFYGGIKKTKGKGKFTTMPVKPKISGMGKKTRKQK